MRIMDTLQRFDVMLIVTALLIASTGVVLIASATSTNEAMSDLWAKQLIFLGLGLGLMIFVALVSYRFWLKLAWVFYFGSVIMLVALFVYGRVAGGARSWISIGGMGFQPSEFTKIALILMLAAYFTKLEKNSLGLADLIKPGVLFAIPLLLTAIQPDLGTAFTMIPLFLGVVFVSGLRTRAIVALVLICIILVSFSWMFLLKDYQKERLRSFMNPEDDPKKSGYQIKQSLIAIGSGGMTGKGLFLGSQSQLNFVPAQHTDFIFSVLGEELGFLAVAGVLMLYLLLFVKPLFHIREVHDVSGVLIVIGVVSYLSFQTLVNVLMSIGLFPTTGVPLPFLSYGGSSLMANMIAVGLVINILANRGAEQSEFENLLNKK